MEIKEILSIIQQFEYYKMLAEKAIEQCEEKKLFIQHHDNDNSIGIIVKHMSGNMLSRWTDFLTTDGEKEWRKRDDEFENDIDTKKQLMEYWNQGWSCLFTALQNLTSEDMEKTVYIRNQGHSVAEAIYRQMMHYAYHVGQIVFIAKFFKENDWQSLSIPKGASNSFNADKFSEAKHEQHFTQEFLKKK